MIRRLTDVLEEDVVDAWVILAEDPFFWYTTSLYLPSISGSGFFSVAAVGAAVGTDGLFGGFGGF